MKDLLLFDGTCGLCTWAATVAKRLDRRSRFEIEPYQRYSEADLARFGLSCAQCDRKVQAVSAAGKLHSGAFAVNYFLWRQFPWNMLVVIIYALPVLLVMELAGYSLVAHNRRRISAWLGLKACTPRTPFYP